MRSYRYAAFGWHALINSFRVLFCKMSRVTNIFVQQLRSSWECDIIKSPHLLPAAISGAAASRYVAKMYIPLVLLPCNDPGLDR